MKSNLKNTRIMAISVVCVLLFAVSCAGTNAEIQPPEEVSADENGVQAQSEKPEPARRPPVRIEIEKALTFDKYTLADTFPYKGGHRVFQWDKIGEMLRIIDSVQLEPTTWGVFQNRKNVNGEGPLVETWERNSYNRVADMYGVERWQGIPLFVPGNDSQSESPESSGSPKSPERYGRDGSFVRVLRADTTDRMLVAPAYIGGQWEVASKYVKVISDTVVFRKVMAVDRTNQNIATLEKVDGKWLVRSMNPATTGVHNPPYAQETPLGIFVLQEKKQKMLYTHDGSSELAGFAPWANRFSNGGYIHGVPTNDPNGSIIEYSATLGTIPRSHMCVRNASSHARFVYDWAPLLRSLVVVIE